MSGPLAGIRVVELPNIGPVQFAGMVLSDLGAEVLRCDRRDHVVGGTGPQGPIGAHSVLDRGRRSIGVDLKHPDGVATVLRLCERADVLVEGFRPGVAERLGVGPEACRERNPRLVYGRMTGWGQEGPLAGDVGHDLNYIALAGVLAHVGTDGGPPVPPINLVGDFGGGAMLLVTGVLAALVERSASGEGQVVDAAMIDGSASLMAIFHALDQMGVWGERGTNLLDGGAHFYGPYETADGEWITVASFEPRFYAELRDVLGLDDLDGSEQMDRARWPALRARVAEIVRTRTRAEWEETMAGRDVCFAPVLTMAEARRHPHHVARGTFTTVAGVEQPAPAPRFDRTPAAVARPPVPCGTYTRAALTDWGFDDGEIARLREAGAVA